MSKKNKSLKKIEKLQSKLLNLTEELSSEVHSCGRDNFNPGGTSTAYLRAYEPSDFQPLNPYTPLSAEDKQRVMDASASATIIAAIIGAVATTASTVAVAAQNIGGSPVFGVVSNESTRDFKVFSFAPNHGFSFESPDFEFRSSSWVEAQFMASVTGEFGSSPTNQEIAEVKGRWIADGTFEDKAKRCVAKFGGTGSGMGFEQVIVFYDDERSVMLLVRKIPGGEYGVGISVTLDLSFLHNAWKNKDKFADKIRKHIMKQPDQYTRFSDGGWQVEVAFKDLRISASAPGQKIEVVITENS